METAKFKHLKSFADFINEATENLDHPGFKQWFDENQDNEELKAKYESYKADCEKEEGSSCESFKKWMKKEWEELDK